MPVSKDSAAFAWIAFIPSSGCEVSGLKTRFISAFWSPQVANRDLAKYTYRLYRGAPTDFFTNVQNYLKLISKSVGTSVGVQTGGEISELIYFSIFCLSASSVFA